jgi:GNAT superfamily N-acetyltransferase
MENKLYVIRSATPSEFVEVGKLMVNAYSQLEGFPKEAEQPNYYKMLANVGEFTTNPGVELLVAVSTNDKILGAVVYFNDMRHYYGSGGMTSNEKGAGFRLLAVDPSVQGKGIGKTITLECIRRAKVTNCGQLIIHSTKAMQIAWRMYESLGFKRSEDLDFMQGNLQVFGFRLLI